MKPLPSLAICFCLFNGLSLPLRASDLPAHRVGDVAEADVITPVALDVEDSAATAVLQAAKATQYPSVFRSLPQMTNIMTRDFLAAFAQARTNFLADLAAEFHATKVPETVVVSADFGGLVTAFGVEHRRFPVSVELAAEWACGGDGQAIQKRLLASLLQAANRPVRPDALPKGMIVGESVRLVPVTDEQQKLSYETVQAGRLVPATSLMTVSNVRAFYRRAFPPGQQVFARAMADFIRPNCLPDAPFTDLTRGTAVCNLLVSDHFDAGDVIIHRGEKMNAKTLAALAALSEKLQAGSASPITPSVPAADAPPRPPPTPAPGIALATPATAPLMTAPPAPVRAPARLVTPASAKPPPLPPPPAMRTGLRHQGLIVMLAGVSVIALLVAGWLLLKSRTQAATSSQNKSDLRPASFNLQTVPPAVPLRSEELLGKFSTRGPQFPPAAQAPLPFLEALPANLTPQVTQAVREAVQQELGAQRHELLLAQLAATDKISVLVQRLDELQVPMEARLHTYETRIQMLEKELALSNAENRELLKAKIEVVTRQLATERAAAAPLAGANPPGPGF